MHAANIDLLVHHFDSDVNISTMIKCIAMKFCRDFDDPQRMRLADFDDPLMFPLVLP